MHKNSNGLYGGRDTRSHIITRTHSIYYNVISACSFEVSVCFEILCKLAQYMDMITDNKQA